MKPCCVNHIPLLQEVLDTTCGQAPGLTSLQNLPGTGTGLGGPTDATIGRPLAGKLGFHTQVLAQGENSSFLNTLLPLLDQNAPGICSLSPCTTL